MLMKHLKLFVYLFAAFAFSSAHAGSYEDFFTAIKRDDPGTIQQLVARGFDPNSRDPAGLPALFLAVRSESYRAAEAIAAAEGLEVDAANEVGETALMIAAIKGQTDWVKRLLERGAQVNKTGWTALHYAASGPNPEIVRMLIERGADIEAESPNRSTALMMAAGYGPEDSVNLLLARSADPKRQNDRKLNAVDFARRAQRDALADRLEQVAAKR